LQNTEIKKKSFFYPAKTAFALSNIDDKNGAVMLQNSAAKKRSYV
jgi:UDP-N-acetylmuramoyl-L-alanyl-D-glutamate--2,6-diaminopimelate ligase